MRFIHTSDLHLGQRFHRRDRQREHDAFLAWLVERFVDTGADAILIAGDVFDVASPPSFARQQLAGLVHDIHKAGGQLVILGGNHDSAHTLSENLKPWGLLSARVVPSIDADDPAANVHVINRRDGRAGMILCAIPFIHEREIVRSVAGQSDSERRAALETAIIGYYKAIYDAARAVREQLGLELPIVATGHLTTVGASASESVRDIYVGNLEALPTDRLPPADYIALGHIHRAMTVGGQAHIRYSGSPIPLSFDELNIGKQVLLVSLGPDQARSIEPIAVPRFQPMGRISSTLDGLEEALKSHLAQQPAEPGQPTWLEVGITDAGYLPDLGERVRQLAEAYPVDVLRITITRPAAALEGIDAAPHSLEDLTPAEVFESLLEKRGSEIPAGRLPRMRELFADIAAEIAQGTPE